MKAIVMIFALAFVSSAFAQTPDAPQPKTFTRSSSIEMTLLGAAISVDAFSSYKSPELNPIARPFISSKTGTAAYFGASFAGLVYANHLLRNHPRWRHVMNWSVIGSESFLAAHNLNLSPRNQPIQQQPIVVNSPCLKCRAN